MQISLFLTKQRSLNLRPMLKLLIDAYKNGEVDTIEVAYPSFVNVLVQEPVLQSLLPIVDLREVLDQLKKRVADLPSWKHVAIPVK